MLCTTLLGLVCSAVMRSEYHSHEDATPDHAHHAWQADHHVDPGTAPDEPAPESLHAHALVAPVALQTVVLQSNNVEMTPPAWVVQDASAVPRSVSHGTPHRPPIA